MCLFLFIEAKIFTYHIEINFPNNNNSYSPNFCLKPAFGLTLFLLDFTYSYD